MLLPCSIIFAINVLKTVLTSLTPPFRRSSPSGRLQQSSSTIPRSISTSPRLTHISPPAAFDLSMNSSQPLSAPALPYPSMATPRVKTPKVRPSPRVPQNLSQTQLQSQAMPMQSSSLPSYTHSGSGSGIISSLQQLPSMFPFISHNYPHRVPRPVEGNRFADVWAFTYYSLFYPLVKRGLFADLAESDKAFTSPGSPPSSIILALMCLGQDRGAKKITQHSSTLDDSSLSQSTDTIVELTSILGAVGNRSPMDFIEWAIEQETRRFEDGDESSYSMQHRAQNFLRLSDLLTIRLESRYLERSSGSLSSSSNESKVIRDNPVPHLHYFRVEDDVNSLEEWRNKFFAKKPVTITLPKEAKKNSGDPISPLSSLPSVLKVDVWHEQRLISTPPFILFDVKGSTGNQQSYSRSSTKAPPFQYYPDLTLPVVVDQEEGSLGDVRHVAYSLVGLMYYEDDGLPFALIKTSSPQSSSGGSLWITYGDGLVVPNINPSTVTAYGNQVFMLIYQLKDWKEESRSQEQSDSKVVLSRSQPSSSIILQWVSDALRVAYEVGFKDGRQDMLILQQQQQQTMSQPRESTITSAEITQGITQPPSPANSDTHIQLSSAPQRSRSSSIPLELPHGLGKEEPGIGVADPGPSGSDTKRFETKSPNSGSNSAPGSLFNRYRAIPIEEPTSHRSGSASSTPLETLRNRSFSSTTSVGNQLEVSRNRLLSLAEPEGLPGMDPLSVLTPRASSTSSSRLGFTRQQGQQEQQLPLGRTPFQSPRPTQGNISGSLGTGIQPDPGMLSISGGQLMSGSIHPSQQSTPIIQPTPHMPGSTNRPRRPQTHRVEVQGGNTMTPQMQQPGMMMYPGSLGGGFGSGFPVQNQPGMDSTPAILGGMVRPGSQPNTMTPPMGPSPTPPIPMPIGGGGLGGRRPTSTPVMPTMTPSLPSPPIGTGPAISVSARPLVNWETKGGTSGGIGLLTSSLSPRGSSKDSAISNEEESKENKEGRYQGEKKFASIVNPSIPIREPEFYWSSFIGRIQHTPSSRYLNYQRQQPQQSQKQPIQRQPTQSSQSEFFFPPASFVSPSSIAPVEYSLDVQTTRRPLYGHLPPRPNYAGGQFITPMTTNSIVNVASRPLDIFLPHQSQHPLLQQVAPPSLPGNQGPPTALLSSMLRTPSNKNRLIQDFDD